MKCWKGLGDFVPFLVRHMNRSDNRDHMEVALGKVRDLRGEVWAQRPMSLFSGVVRGHRSTSSRGIDDVGWQLTTSVLGHKVWASRIVASLKRFSPSGKYRFKMCPNRCWNASD